MHKIEKFVCDKCGSIFATGDECHRHEQHCGESIRVVELWLTVEDNYYHLLESVTTGCPMDGDCVEIETYDDDGYVLKRSIVLDSPEIASYDPDSYEFVMWTRDDDSTIKEAEQKLKDYAVEILMDHSKKMQMLAKKVPEAVKNN